MTNFNPENFNPKMKVYFLSGLGADKTVFQLLDLEDYEPVYIEWIDPLKRESLPHYASRIKEMFIPKNAVIIGLSFGGMLAIEMAKSNPDLKVILLSSAKVKSELPYYFNIGKWLPLHRIATPVLQKNTMLHMKWLFGLKAKPAIKIYEDLIKNSNSKFNAWAIESILAWKNTQMVSNAFHIHGTADKVLPLRNIKADWVVKNGGHLMLLEKPGLISDILIEIIRNFSSHNTSLPLQLHQS